MIRRNVCTSADAAWKHVARQKSAGSPHSGNLELRNATSYDLREVVSRNADDRAMIRYF